jgi:hypothetical protein
MAHRNLVRIGADAFIGRTLAPGASLIVGVGFGRRSFVYESQLINGFWGSRRGNGLFFTRWLEEARTLIILTILFVLGRVLFWVGYHINPYVRAFGFGLTFYPTVVVYAWLILAMVFGIRVPL